jgi:hypothetical protein
VADLLPELSDEEVELLRRLSMPPDTQQSLCAEPRSLTDALRSPRPLGGINSKALARPPINKTARELSRLMESQVTLLRAQGKRGTFATDSCQALNPALEKIIQERDRVRAEAMRRRRLEWLQLSSCLDKAPLRVGAYQAHAERFLGSAGQLMYQFFDWLDFSIDVEENRKRTDRSRGVLRDRFDDGAYDFMLVPRASEPVHLETVYSYSFRIVGNADKLNSLKNGQRVIHVRQLQGERLLVAPSGSSSRRRLRELLLDAGVDIEDGSVDLIEEVNPSSMRIRAESGQALAIISDEYTAVGGSRLDFPCLALGDDADHLSIHRVEMGLLRQPDANMPRHRAFDFVIEELIAREKACERAAAQG